MQVLESIRDLFKNRVLQGFILVTYGLCILGVLMGSQDFVTHFLDEALS